MDLNLFGAKGGKLDPLSYSNGKDQAEVTEEVLEAFESHDLVFLKAVVGSGKSVIGIRTALEFGRGIVSVPTKVLSHQYQDDYGGEKYFQRNDGSRVEISLLKGRGNFTCPWIQVKHPEWEYKTCRSQRLPCTRATDSRLEALKDCPYWGFIFPADSDLGGELEHIETYKGVRGHHSLLLSEDACDYWDQYRGYLTSDIIVLNSKKWEIESMIGRLPQSDITVIDEADAWLNGLTSKVTLSIRRIRGIMNKFEKEDMQRTSETIHSLWEHFWSEEEDMTPFSLAEKLASIFRGSDLSIDLYYQLVRILDFKEEVVVSEEENEERVTYYIPDPKTVLSKILERVGGKFLMMSATCQSEEVLNRIYDIDPIFIEGETRFPGEVVQMETGHERKVNYDRWRKPSFRRGYAKLRNRIIDEMKKPGFCPVHARKYLPDEIDNVTNNDEVEYNGVRFSTKMDRGADLGEIESIIVLKYPFPDTSDPLLKATKKKLGDEKFWPYYRDMARRNFIQQVGRTVRLPDDEVEFWSPDKQCHSMLQKHWEGEIVPDLGVKT